MIVGAASLAAQTPSASAPADAGHIAEEVARQAGVLAADSFQGRTTPSPALERTARYLSSEFARLGLAPVVAVDRAQGQWTQRYPVPGGARVDPAGTAIVLTVLDSTIQARLIQRPDRQEARRMLDGAAALADTAWLRRSAYFTMPLIPRQPRAVDGESWATVVVAGPLAPDSLAAAWPLADKSVLYVPPAGLDSAAQARVIARLAAATGLGVLVLAPDASPADSAAFAARWQSAQAHLPAAVDIELQNTLRPHGWVAHVWPGAVAGALAAARLDLAALRAARTPVVRSVPALKVDLQLSLTEPDSSWPTAPNVLGWLAGRDSTHFVHMYRDSARLNEFVLVMARMDEASPSLAPPDGPAAGPSGAAGRSNTLGVAGLLALAQAFGQPETRPRRSMLFLVTSGGATPALAGAHWSQAAGLPFQSRLYPLAAVLNLDQLEPAAGDSGAGDSVWVDGLREVEGMPTVDWLAAAHPELGLKVVDGGTAFAPRSDHFGFARWRRPMLYFHATPSAGTRPPGPGPAVPDARAVARAARIAQLVFHVATAMANGDRLPQLNETGRASFMAAIEHLP